MIVRYSLAALCLMAVLLLAFQPGLAQDRPRDKPKDESQQKEESRIKAMQEELKAMQAEMEKGVRAFQTEMEKRRAMIEKAMQEEMKAMQAEMEKRRAIMEKKGLELRDAMLKREGGGRGLQRIQPESVPGQPPRTGGARPDMDRRLGEIEQKLHQILREVENLRRELGGQPNVGPERRPPRPGQAIRCPSPKKRSGDLQVDGHVLGNSSGPSQSDSEGGCNSSLALGLGKAIS